MVPAWGRDTCCGVFEIAGSLFDRERRPGDLGG